MQDMGLVPSLGVYCARARINCFVGTALPYVEPNSTRYIND